MMNGLASNPWNTYQDQDAASSDSKLPIKGKLSFKERNAAVGREATLQKQLQEAAKDRQDLVKRYEIKDQKCNELRDKLKVTKAALSSRERELEVAQRMLQKLGTEKNQLRDENAEHKVYIRKLETKLDELKNVADISSKYQAAKQKANEVQHQLVSVSAELGASREVAAQRQKEIDRLTRALDIRASKLSQEAGGQDIPARLLHSLAESREESLELAKQLAATKAEMSKLRQSAARLSSRTETAELMRADAEVAAEQLRQRLEKLLGSSQEATRSRADMAQLLVAARSEAECFKSERDELAEVVLEMQEEIEQLKATTAAAKTNAELAAAAAADEAMHRLANTHAAAQGARQQQMAREAQLSRRCTELAEQMSQLEAALQQQLQAAQQTAASRQHQIMVLESQLASRRQRELDLERQVAELQSRADRLGGAVSSAEAAASRNSQLEQQVVRLEASLRVASVERQQLEQRLKQASDDAAAQQQEAQQELDALRVQLAAKEAAHRCALEDAAGLQKQLSDVLSQLDKTTAAKAQLQNNMLHQITSIKEKLQVAEQQSQQQLLAPGSPLFPARHRSSSNPRGSMQHRSSSRASAGVEDSAVLAAARMRAKGGTSKPGSCTGSPNAAASRAVGRPRSQAMSVHSTGSISSNAAAARQLQLGRNGSSDVAAAAAAASRAAGEHLAAATAARVAEFAASLQQQTDAMEGYMQHVHSHGLDVSAAAAAAVGSIESMLMGVLGRPGSSLAAPTAAGPAAAAVSPSILRRSLDNSVLLRPGSIYGLEHDTAAPPDMQYSRGRVGYSPSKQAAAPGQLTSPPESLFGPSSGGGAAAGYSAKGSLIPAISGRPGSNVGQDRQQLRQGASRGLADDIDSMSWMDILKVDSTTMGAGRSSALPQRPQSQTAAAYGPSSGRNSQQQQQQLERYSPQDSDSYALGARGSAARVQQEGSSHLSGGSSRAAAAGAAYPAAEEYTPGHSINQRQQQQQDPRAGSLQISQQRSSSSDAYSDSRNARAVTNSRSLADHNASSQPAEAGDSRPQSAAAAAQAARSNLSWLQQPMEPYSPTVAAPGGGAAARNNGTSGVHSLLHGSGRDNAQQGGPTAQAGAAGGNPAGARRGDDLADPYSLPASAEQSAVSLHSTIPGSSVLGSYGGAAVSVGGAGPYGTSGGGAGHRQQQQRQPGRAAPQQEHPGHERLQRPAPTADRQQVDSSRRDHAAAEAARLGSGAQEYSATELLHACGAWEVTFDSDSNADEQQDSNPGRRSSNSNDSEQEHEQLRRVQEYQEAKRQQQQQRRAVEFAADASTPQQGSPHLADHAAGMQQQQSRMHATGAASHSPEQLHTAGSHNPHLQQMKVQWNSQMPAVRASADMLQQQHRSGSHNSSHAAAAAAAGRSGSALGGRRLSDGSSSGSNGQNQQGPEQQSRVQNQQSLYQDYAGAGGAQQQHFGAELLSPPSTVKHDAVMARRPGLRQQEPGAGAMQHMPMDSNRPSAAMLQQQPRSSKGLPSDPSLASWNGQENRTKDGSSVQRHMQQHSQQYNRGQSSILAAQPPTGAYASAGSVSAQQTDDQGYGGSVQQYDDRGSGGRASAMDALLAKLSEGEPTLQDLAELESML